jgi:hypothetical protein
MGRLRCGPLPRGGWGGHVVLLVGAIFCCYAGALYAHCPSSGTRSGALGLRTTPRSHSYVFFSSPPPPSLSVRAEGRQWGTNTTRLGSSY